MKAKRVWGSSIGFLARVAKKIAVVNNYILLTVVYILGIGLTSIFAKLLRKHFLELKPRSKKSYWITRKQENYSKKETYRSF